VGDALKRGVEEMPTILDSVGETGSNRLHDVALVQAMLRVVKNAKGVSYLNSNYDGKYGPGTKAAITDFQIDNKLAEAPQPHAKEASNPQPAGKETLGIIRVGSATFQSLTAALPAEFSSMRIMENTSTVYMEGDKAAASASQSNVLLQTDLESSFRANVVRLVDLMYKTHGIVLSIAPKGTRRTFQGQADLSASVTNAGPGESYHNFGQAVDIGFNGLKWLAGDGKIVQDDWWLKKLEKVSSAKCVAFWEARDKIADIVSPNLYRIETWDRPHLQTANKAQVSMGRSLVALLNAVGKTKWALGGGSPNHYKSDLGLGGKKHDVGTARQIWAGNATVTKAMLAEAQSAKLKQQVKVTDIKDADVSGMQSMLKADFQAADSNWNRWNPVR
jgi:peptidoglycan hydrolase-like protein with peptidoglycan-binding domain